MGSLSQTLLGDTVFQVKTFFPRNNINTVFAICHPNDTFLMGIMMSETYTCSITNLISTEHLTDAKRVASHYDTKYSFITDAKDIISQSYSAVYISTGNVALDARLTQQLLEKKTCSQILFTMNTTLQSIYIPPGYTALPIVPNICVIFESKEPLAITWLRNVYKPYNFNSSCVAIDKKTAKPSCIETAGTDLLFSVRVANSKFTESDLIF